MWLLMPQLRNDNNDNNSDNDDKGLLLTLTTITSSEREGLPWQSCGLESPHFQRKGHGFDPWGGNKDSTCYTVWPRRKKIYI